MRTRTVAIVQARMSSTRLPGKSLAQLGHTSVLAWTVRRVRMASNIDDVAIATSTDPSDDPIRDEGLVLGVSVVRGSLEDVLDRYDAATRATLATTVVRLTADCPFVDPLLVSNAVNTLQAEDADYASTNLGASILHGLDVEVVRSAVIAAAAAEATDPAEREHVTPFIYRRPERFRCVPVKLPSWASHAELRLTIDEARDLQLARAIVDLTTGIPEEFSTPAAVSLLLNDPRLAAINAGVQHRRLQ